MPDADRRTRGPAEDRHLHEDDPRVTRDTALAAERAERHKVHSRIATDLPAIEQAAVVHRLRGPST